MKGASLLPRILVLGVLLISTVVEAQTTAIPSTTSSPATTPTPSTSTITQMPSPTSTSVSLTPAESAASVSSFFAALASVSPQQPGSGLAPGEGDPNDVGGDGNAGAEGTDTESITLSTGAIIAIAVIVGGVIIIGITTATLWYFAKKRSWEVRASIRRSARKVVTAITPRRSTFPKDVRKSRRFSRGLTRIEEVPNTPLHDDVEKAKGRMSAFEFTEPEAPRGKRGWGSKFGIGR